MATSDSALGAPAGLPPVKMSAGARSDSYNRTACSILRANTGLGSSPCTAAPNTMMTSARRPVPRLLAPRSTAPHAQMNAARTHMDSVERMRSTGRESTPTSLRDVAARPRRLASPTQPPHRLPPQLVVAIILRAR
jgi:hypothetical protein